MKLGLAHAAGCSLLADEAFGVYNMSELSGDVDGDGDSWWLWRWYWLNLDFYFIFSRFG